MAWAADLAREFRNRDNRPAFLPQIGEVVSTAPLRIALLSDAGILGPEQIYLCSALAEGQPRQIRLDGPNGSQEAQMTVQNILQVGDLVACVPTAQTPKFIAVDKVVTA